MWGTLGVCPPEGGELRWYRWFPLVVVGNSAGGTGGPRWEDQCSGRRPRFPFAQWGFDEPHHGEDRTVVKSIDKALDVISGTSLIVSLSCLLATRLLVI